MSKPKLYIMSGPPASGKSTFIKTLPESVVRVSPDNFVYNEEGEYEWTPQRAKAAWRSAEALLAKTLAEGRDVVFDATMTASKRRVKFLRKISRYKGYDNYKVIAVSMPVLPIETLLERNSRRSPDRQVPGWIIKNMLEKYTGNGPSREEGFDDVICPDCSKT